MRSEIVLAHMEGRNPVVDPDMMRRIGEAYQDFMSHDGQDTTNFGTQWITFANMYEDAMGSHTQALNNKDVESVEQTGGIGGVSSVSPNGGEEADGAVQEFAALPPENVPAPTAEQEEEALTAAAAPLPGEDDDADLMEQ